MNLVGDGADAVLAGLFDDHALFAHSDTRHH